MAQGFPKGDPRAREAGRRGGLKAHHAVIRSEDWKSGYRAGWIAGKRKRLSRRRSAVIPLT